MSFTCCDYTECLVQYYEWVEDGQSVQHDDNRKQRTNPNHPLREEVEDRGGGREKEREREGEREREREREGERIPGLTMSLSDLSSVPGCTLSVLGGVGGRGGYEGGLRLLFQSSLIMTYLLGWPFIHSMRYLELTEKSIGPVTRAAVTLLPDCQPQSQVGPRGQPSPHDAGAAFPNWTAPQNSTLLLTSLSALQYERCGRILYQSACVSSNL